MLITQHVTKGNDHTTFYLACGPSDGLVTIFVHGWPISIVWQHQLPVFEALRTDRLVGRLLAPHGRRRCLARTRPR